MDIFEKLLNDVFAHVSNEAGAIIKNFSNNSIAQEDMGHNSGKLNMATTVISLIQDGYKALQAANANTNTPAAPTAPVTQSVSVGEDA